MNSPRGVLSLKRSDPPADSALEERLHKVLANAGLGSRRLLEERIGNGEVLVNGSPAQTGSSVRAGDRVTVSGVTGDIVQIGLMRLYMRELKDAENGYQPTGKIVAFPNSILFQPSAFYKHIDRV